MTATTQANKILPTPSSLMEQFPDMLPDTKTMCKKWIWKEETNTLEQVNGGLQLPADKQMVFNKPKKSAKQSSRRMTISQSAQKRRNLLTDRKGTNAISPNPSMKIHTTEKRSITLNDVKGVSYDLLAENNELPEIFQEILRNNHLDELLTATLCYFNSYFDSVSMETKPNTMLAEPSMAEKKATLIARAKLESAKKLLSEKYCSLILGLDTREHHHLLCGSQRKSFTNRDRKFFEALYSYCCLVVWIAFKRTYLEVIQNELGRLFRSDAFNPYRDPVNQKDFSLASDLTSQQIHDVKFIQPSLRKHKRPPISSIIDQRSPVLVALFPTSKDSSAWLLDRRKHSPPHKRKEDCSENYFDEETDPSKLKVGIIGEMISGFNPFTLAPFGDDGEYEDDEEEQEKFDAEHKIKDEPHHGNNESNLIDEARKTSSSESEHH